MIRWFKELVCGILGHAYVPHGLFSSMTGGPIPAKRCLYCPRVEPIIEGRTVAWGE